MTRWIVLAVTGGFLAVFVSNPAAVKTKKAINEQQLLIHAIPAPKDGEAKKKHAGECVLLGQQDYGLLNSTAELGRQRQKAHTEGNRSTLENIVKGGAT